MRRVAVIAVTIAAAAGGILYGVPGGPIPCAGAADNASACATPQFGSSNCSTSDSTGCVAYIAANNLRTVTFTNPAGAVICDSNILTDAPAGGVVTGSGGYPVMWRIIFTPGTITNSNGVGLQGGCDSTNQSSTTCDLVIVQDGDGKTTGFGNDASRLGSGRGDNGNQLNVCDSTINGGPRNASIHQDCMQIFDASNTHFYDTTFGNFAANTATSLGSGGCPFFSGPNAGTVGNITFARTQAVFCFNGLKINRGGSPSWTTENLSFTNDVYRTGTQNLGSCMTNGQGHPVVDPNVVCTFPATWTFTNVSAYQQGVAGYKTFCPLVQH